jgi:hypothetical protein
MVQIVLLFLQDDWWNAEWKWRRKVVVQNNLDGVLKAGHQASVELDPDYLGLAPKSARELADLVLVHDGKEIPCALRSGRRGRVEAWFRLPADIAKEGRDDRFALYYGNAQGKRSAGDRVFDYFDDGSGRAGIEADSDVRMESLDGKLVITDASSDRTENSPALVRLKMEAIPENFAVTFDLECEPDPNASFAFGIRVNLKEKIEADKELQKKIDELIDKLGDFDWEAREAATKELIKIGRPAIPRLEEALKASDAEVKWRAEHILKEIRDASPWPMVMAGIRVGDPEVSPVAMSWRIGRSYNRQRLGPLGPVRLTLTVARDQDGFVTVLWNGGRPSSGELKGEVDKIAFYLYKGTTGKPGVIRLDNITVRRFIDDDSKPTSTIEVEEARK